MGWSAGWRHWWCLVFWATLEAYSDQQRSRLTDVYYLTTELFLAGFRVDNQTDIFNHESVYFPI